MDRQPEAPTSSPRSPSASRIWIPVGLAAAVLLSGAAVVTRHLSGLQARLDEAELGRARQAADLRSNLDGVRSELGSMKSELGTAFQELETAHDLSRRLASAEEHLGSIGAAVEAQASTLEELEETQASFAPGIEKELEERDARLQKRYESLTQLAEDARRAASASEQRITELDRTLSAPPDLETMWRDLVGPVVQLAGETSVGSGVLLRSEALPEGGFRTRVLTAWHVVRDIQGDPPDLTMPVPVQIYREDGGTRHEQAKLLAHDPKLDAALLEVVTPDALQFGAVLAPRSRLESTRIFDPVVAVGCPLGNDPIPTRGEVATCQHEVDGERYWMINAPTYIGNSGGGIFDAHTHQLMGIFSKIYTHGSLRPTIVPHMGLVTPLTRVYDWLATVGYGDLVPSEARAATAASAAAPTPQ
jgi:trypsin-like peptidase